MRKDVVVDVGATDRTRLEMIVADRNSPQKHVWRARIVLLTADRPGTVEIMRRTGKSKTCVWRWQERFMQKGVDALLRDKTLVCPRGILPERLDNAVADSLYITRPLRRFAARRTDPRDATQRGGVDPLVEVA